MSVMYVYQCSCGIRLDYTHTSHGIQFFVCGSCGREYHTLPEAVVSSDTGAHAAAVLLDKEGDMGAADAAGCTCVATCRNTCKGACGCEKCYDEYQDFLSSPG